MTKDKYVRPGCARHRQKGDRVEHSIVALHRAIGIHAERYPLSSASLRNSGNDIDIYINGPDTAPAVAECMPRKNRAGWAVIERHLVSFDFLKSNNKPPLVVMPWGVWAGLLAEVRR